jgi:DNA-binding NarL/FixJ family response regulator
MFFPQEFLSLKALSETERTIARQLSEGKLQKNIAKRFNCQENTIRKYSCLLQQKYRVFLEVKKSLENLRNVIENQ